MSIEPRTLDARIDVLETRLDAHESTLKEVLREVRALTNNINTSPKALPWREVAATIAATLGIFAYTGNYLEGQYHKNNSVLEYRVDQLETRYATRLQEALNLNGKP